MNRYLVILLALLFAVGFSKLVLAQQEHGGQEHAEQEHGGQTTQEQVEEPAPAQVEAKVPTAEEIRSAIRTYIEEQSRITETLDIFDPDTGGILNLSLENVHERVGKTGDYYYSCADLKEKNTSKMYDLDFDVESAADGSLKVVDVRIHKEEGEARYTYDDNDQRIPLKEGTKSHLGSKGSMMEMEEDMQEGPMHEHGGEEHGGQGMEE